MIEVKNLINQLKKRINFKIFEFCFLKMQAPPPLKAIDRCVKKGATEIIVLLNFLNSGRHVLKDIPYIIEAAQTKYPHVKFYLTKPIGQHPGLCDLFVDRVDDVIS